MISKVSIKYCCEHISKIENYDRAISDYHNVWHCHHRKETPEEGISMSKKELIESGLYYNRPASELIFLTPSEHKLLHQSYAKYTNHDKQKRFEYQINGIVSFADFINVKNRIVKKYAIWIFRHPENKKELEQQRDKEITDLLDEYEKKETKSFFIKDKMAELGIKLEIKLICKR